MARPRWSGRTLVVTIGMYEATTRAAAKPCASRPTTTTQNAGATAVSTLAAATPTMASTRAARTSAPSAQRPAGIATAAIGSAWASSTHAVAAASTPRSAAIPGRVTAVTVISAVTTSMARPSAATGAHRVRPGDRAPVVSMPTDARR